jgi:hypothetical protein
MTKMPTSAGKAPSAKFHARQRVRRKKTTMEGVVIEVHEDPNQIRARFSYPVEWDDGNRDVVMEDKLEAV